MKYISLALLAFAIGCGKQSNSSSTGSSQPASPAGGAASKDTPKEAAKSSPEQTAEQIKLSQNKLRQIGLGLFNQQDTYGGMFINMVMLPKTQANQSPKGKGPGPKDKEPESKEKEPGPKGKEPESKDKGPGKTAKDLGVNDGLSWRVSILPFIGEEKLFKKFNLEEPWDSEHNKKLLDEMPKNYEPVNGVGAEKGHTFYRMFDVFGAPHAFPRIPSSFPDGAATTILIIEAGEAVPWTKPEMIPYDAKKPLPKLGALFNGDFNILTADGMPHFIPKTIPEKELRALITPAGADTVTWELGPGQIQVTTPPSKKK